MKSILITQSNYIPWKGYFDSIALVDEIILLDSVQFTRRDWRNRNLIMTQQGPLWLSIPVKSKGKFLQPIDETEVLENWAEKHWKTLSSTYRKHSSKYDEVALWLEPLYQEAAKLKFLTEINELFLKKIASYLGIKTIFLRDRDFSFREDRNFRILDLCLARKATHYYTGSAAKIYIDEKLFLEHGIQTSYLDYTGYQPYPQLGETFQHQVSILDLLFHTGSQAKDYLKYTHTFKMAA